MKTGLIAVYLTPLPAAGTAETRVLKNVDFKVPPEIQALIPCSIKKEDIFTCNDFCSYVFKNQSFVFIGSVG